jgi:PDZ domain-containing protein
MYGTMACVTDPDQLENQAAPPQLSRRQRWASVLGNLAPRTITLLAGAGATLIAGAVMLTLPVPYILEVPGPTVDTLGEQDGKELIQVDQEPTHKITGELRLTTVGAYGSEPGTLTVFQMVKGYFDPDDALIPYDLVYPRQSTSQEREAQSAAQMSSSQDAATVAALEYLGLKVNVQIEEAQTDSARDAFQAGDRITGIDGHPVSGYQELKTELERVKPGTQLQVAIERKQTPQTVEVETVENPAGEGSLLGVTVQFDFPVEVKFGVEDIGGPSAGSMFALGIIDKLGDTDLADGRIVAGTGTVDVDGTIGSIGGIRQKMIGARRDGATVFLAPAGNCAEVKGHEPSGMEVIKVENLADAVTALADLRSGAKNLPRCS